MKIAVLMSGGVDSSVAALLLKRQGHDVTGLTMINWDEAIGEQAEAAAGKLAIEHRVVDLRPVFAQKVIDYFCRSYEKGQTPNPCVECNRSIKFGFLLEEARKMGCESVATGHYARVEYDGGCNRYLLKKGIDPGKDQSYFLWTLNQEQLAAIVFPLGAMSKQDVRCLARDYELPAADSRESQEICFIQDDYRVFIKDKVASRPGEITDSGGKVLGRHRGLPFYTVGQRKGLGVAAGRPLYVREIDCGRNRLVLDDETGLYRSRLESVDNNFILIDKLQEPLAVKTKIRYAAPEADAVIYPGDGRVRVEFAAAQRAVTPGQSVVFYRGDCVVGGGVIAPNT